MGEIVINQVSGGLGIVSPSIDAVSGLLMPVPAAATGGTYTLGNVYRLSSAADAVAMGVDSAYDTANDVNAYQSIMEFFRVNPRATLYIMFVTNATTRAAMFQTALYQDALKLVGEANGTINQLAVACNPSATITDYVVELTAVVGAAQTFAEHCRENARPLHVIIEGYGTFTSGINLTTMNAPQVSVMFGQNDGYYQTSVLAKLHTAIGIALGVVSLAKVNENIGWVGSFNLQAGEFQAARLGGGLISQLSQANADTADANGWIFFKTYTDYPGIYMTDSHTATAVTDDFSKIEYNRTWNKASRLIRAAELPFVNSPINVDPETGFIDPITVANLEAVGNRALKPMFTAGEISGPDPQGPNPPVQINPEQDVLSDPNIDINVSIVPTGTARTLTNNIGFTNPNIN